MSRNSREVNDAKKELRNEDPLSGEAGAHPVATGVGAAVGGATTGAVAGAVAGPAGAVVGAIVGGVVGGLAGKGVAEAYDPTVEVDYWRGEYVNRPYYDESREFDDLEPAYRVGMDIYDSALDAPFEQRESLARARWEKEGNADLTWDEARPAAQDAYTRLAKQRRAK